MNACTPAVKPLVFKEGRFGQEAESVFGTYHIYVPQPSGYWGLTVGDITHYDVLHKSRDSTQEEMEGIAQADYKAKVWALFDVRPVQE